MPEPLNRTNPLSIEGWSGEARFSECGNYRYTLTRRWQDGRGTCVFIMLNPSTATATENDPSVRRCMGYARRWGHNRLVVLNLFAFRSTNPKHLYRAVDPIGPKNTDYIQRFCGYADRIVCAWGTHGAHMGRGPSVLSLLRSWGMLPSVLARTKDGTPMHPLYLKGSLEPVRI